MKGAANEMSGPPPMPPDPRDEITTHLGPLRAFARTLAPNRDKADDLVQETLIKALANIDSFEPGTNMRAWLLTILRNSYFSDRRRSWREETELDERLLEGLSRQPDHDGWLALSDFARAFMALPATQREALGLVGLQGLSYAEAAQISGCAVGTIKSRVARARGVLSENLGLGSDPGAELTDRMTLAAMSTCGYGSSL